MREVLDCAVLLAPGHERAMEDWVNSHQAGLPRVRLRPVPLARQVGPTGADVAPPRPDTLARLALALKRFDSCILPVAPATLSWARMALQQASKALTTPILLLTHDMKAPAILDLLTLGAADFIEQPACLESMRVRLGRLASAASLHSSEPAGGVQERPPAYRGAQVGPDAASAAAGLRPRVSTQAMEHALTSMRHQCRLEAQESFRLAKARVVEGFECEYIRHALSRHGGNVAQAARACAKHRRAFWALMRKHGIEAAPYRQISPSQDL